MKYRLFLYVILINAYWTKHENCIKIIIVLMRTCLHKYDEWIFEQDFVDGKAKSCRNAFAFQMILTQSSAKFAEKTPIYLVKTSSE